MYRLSTKNYNPRATGSLRHLMLKVLARHTLTAPSRLNYSTFRAIVPLKMDNLCYTLEYLEAVLVECFIHILMVLIKNLFVTTY